MTKETTGKNIYKDLPPGVCVPCEEKLKEIGEIKGDPGIIKKEWEQLDAFAYMYIWGWVHR